MVSGIYGTLSRKTATIFGQGTIPEPSTPHIGKEVALVAPDSSFRVHIGQNPLDSRNDTQLPRNSISLCERREGH
jgi:hypothetical protein